MRRPLVSGVAALGGGTLLAGLGLGLRFDALALVRLGVLGAALGVVVYTDLREHRIPNRVVLPASLACAVLSVLDGVQLGALTVGCATVIVLFVVSAIRPAWFGMGDVKLVLLMLCGLHAAAPRAVELAFALYGLIAVVLIVRRGRAALRIALPLAPALAAGSLLVLVV